MFGGKKEKILKEIENSRENALEQFASITASHAQVNGTLDEIKNQMERVAELAKESQMAAGDIHNTLMGVNNAVESFDANHTVFMAQLKKQNEKIQEQMDLGKTLQPPVLNITQCKEEMKDAVAPMQDSIDEMKEYAKTMGVLALNAAIEAGRLGDAGMSFMNAAEEVRSFSEKYTVSALQLEEQITQSTKRIEELEKEVEQLNSSVKENTISMGKLYSSAMQTVATYEAGQIDLRESLSDNTIGRVDALQQAGEEFVGIGQKTIGQVEQVCEEILEQKKSEDELEHIYKKLQQSVENA